MDLQKNPWNFQALYDALMLEIEPELTCAMLKQFPVLHQNDTPAMRCECLQRYAEAFAEYDRRVAKLKSILMKALRAFAMQARRGADMSDPQRTFLTLCSTVR